MDLVEIMRERINRVGELITADGHAKAPPLLQAELSGRGCTMIRRTFEFLGSVGNGC